LSFDLPSGETWALLARQDQSDWTVQFSQVAYFSLTDSAYANLSDVEIAEKMRAAANADGVNLIIACGTTGSLAAKQLSADCGVISLAAADPLKSKIVDAEKTSQTENVWAVMDTDAFRRSIMVMNDIFAPKTVGVVYADNEETYIYSGADELDKFAAENGITVKKRFVDDPETTDSDAGQRKYERELATAFADLADEVDVFIMTTSLLEMEDMKPFFAPFYARSVPVYSINSTEDVQYGALMAVESSDYKNIGRFTADTLAAHLAGEPLSELPQVYQTAPFLVLNYGAAKQIGYKPDFQLLLVASEIYMD
jgi:ABC-type uncharacterized transport system substrate-binding protein